MPVREQDRRSQELQQQEARRAQLVEALRDQDWIERLAANEDFKKFFERIKATQSIALEHKEECQALLGKPITMPGRRAALNETLLVSAAMVQTTEDIIGWPAAQEQLLKDARKELPTLEANIKKLKRQNNG